MGDRAAENLRRPKHFAKVIVVAFVSKLLIMVLRIRHKSHEVSSCKASRIMRLLILVLGLALVESRSSWQQRQQQEQLTGVTGPSAHHHHRASVADLERLLMVAADREQLERHRRRIQQHRSNSADSDYSLQDNNYSSDSSSDEVGSPLSDDYYEESLPRAPRLPYRHRHLHQQRAPTRRLRRGRHRGHSVLLDPLELTEQARDNFESGASEKDLVPLQRNYRARDKRYNGGIQRYKSWTEEDRKAFESSRQGSNPELYNHLFEVEVREAQNSSLCNYTIIPIPDPGGRIPRELEHVKCNHVGSRCQDKGTYCCLQTYRNVQVVYEDGKMENIKVYSGCVCSLQLYGTLKPFNPNLPTND